MPKPEADGGQEGGDKDQEGVLGAVINSARKMAGLDEVDGGTEEGEANGGGEDSEAAAAGAAGGGAGAAGDGLPTVKRRKPPVDKDAEDKRKQEARNAKVR